MKKEELIEELKKEIEATKNVLNCEEHFSLYAKGKRVGLEFGWMFAEKLDEPELPVIPQFVASAIEKTKENRKNITILNIFNEVTVSGFYTELVDDWILKNPDLFTIAWFSKEGYTIEPEKKYILKNKRGFVSSIQVEQSCANLTSDIKIKYTPYEQDACKFRQKEKDFFKDSFSLEEDEVTSK